MSRIWASIKALFRGLWSLIKKWPVRFQALIVALIALGSAFGLAWNGVQVAAVTAFSAAVLSFLTEQAVTPVAEPTLASGTMLTVTTPGPTADRTVTV